MRVAAEVKDVPAYLLIGATAVASALGAPAWIIFLAAIPLAMSAALEHRKLAGIADSTMLQIFLFGGWKSIGHSVGACAAAYILGHLALLTV